VKSERLTGLLVSVVVGVAAVLSLSTTTQRSLADTTSVTSPEKGNAAQDLLVALEYCENNGPNGCVATWAQTALDAMKPSEAVELVASSDNPTLQRSCHGVMHELGRLSASGKALAAVQELIKAGAAVCQFGFQHGVMIGIAESVADDSEFSGIMAKACDVFPKSGNTYSSCVHGIGHAASSRHPTDLNKAGELCAALGPLVGWCASGAVMEWGASSAEALNRSEGGTKKATETCVSFREAIGDAGYKECVREMPTILYAGQTSREEIAAWCTSVGGENERYACSDGVGFTFGTEMTVTPEAVMTACSALGDAKFVGRCAAAAGGMYYQRDMARNKGAAEEICRVLPAAAQKACDEHLSQTFVTVEATITT
jgi:hypothetical protein